MNLGLVRRGYSDTGGAESYLKRFAAALVSAGHSSMLFTGPRWKGEWPFGKTRVVSGESPRAFADAFAAMEKDSECDTIFSLERVWNCDCYRAGDGVHRAWLERRSRHESAWKTRFRALQPKHRALLEIESRLFKEGARAIIANSNMVKDEIIRCYGTDPGRIHVIHNGIPGIAIPPGARESARERLGLSPEAFVVLFAGTGWDRKGLRFAIQGVEASSANPLLLVAGRGNPKDLPASGRTRFLGPVGDMGGLLAAADLFLLPTVYDPFSNACLEALAAGLPVLTTAANGFAEIIQPGIEGEILPEPSDTAAIAAAIDRWSDPERRLAIKPRLVETVARFTIEANLKATLAVLGI